MRIKEIDFLKGLLILLVISFHLVYIEHLYPYAKQVVYTFHMPAFLVISGYLLNTDKAMKVFLRSLLWLVIPYLVMESGYILMAALLPIGDHIDKLDAAVFFDNLLLHPIGPYWYLHTLIQCKAISYSVMRIESLNNVSQIIMTCLLLYIFSKGFSALSFTSATYFLIGTIMRYSRISLINVCKPSLLAILTFAILIIEAQNLKASTITGIIIVYMSMNSFLTLFRHSGDTVRNALQFCGRNSLSLYLFSPMFTILCKPMSPMLSFDPTGILFLLLALVVCTSGSLLVASIMDKTGMARLMFGKEIYAGY